MKNAIRKVWLLPLLLAAFLCLVPAGAQKVQTSYDGTFDLSRSRTYSLQHPAAEPAHPLLYAHIIGTIEEELKARGLSRTERDGDLIMMLSGGMDYGLGSDSPDAGSASGQAPLADPKEWPGKSAPQGVGGKPMPAGALQLSFMDRATSKIVWTGWVKQKLNADKQSESFDKSTKAIQKLLRDFPPRAQ